MNVKNKDINLVDYKNYYARKMFTGPSLLLRRVDFSLVQEVLGCLYDFLTQTSTPRLKVIKLFLFE